MRSTSGRIAPILFVILFVGVGAVFWAMYQAAKMGPKHDGKTVDAAVVVEEGEMDEAARLEYVKQFIRVNDLTIGPDLKPDSEEPVPGLLRVSGQVVNSGERSINKVNLFVYPQDDQGEVLGSHIQDVVVGPALTPGEVRPFKFQIPEKKAFSGQFQHKLE